jgi:hypothetical protein
MQKTFKLFAATIAVCATAGLTTPVDPTNIALTGSASASAYWESHPAFLPSHVIDGSTYDDVSTGKYWILPNRTAGWWQVDLGADAAIGLIEILNCNNNGSNDRGTKDFRVEILDASSTVVFSQSGILPFTSFSSPSNPTVPYVLDLAVAVTGRYVKVWVDSWYPTRTDPAWPYPKAPSSNLANEGGGLNDVRVYAAGATVNAAPEVAATGGGTYEIGTTVQLGGDVTDIDGDPVGYAWTVGAEVLCTGTVQTTLGGAPVALPSCALPGLGLGTHTATVEVSDGNHPAVSHSVAIEIVDQTRPTLSPEADRKILWPPNHQMVWVTITAQAADNGGSVTLGATVSSNEPQDGLGDGDIAVDWTSPVIDQAAGTVTLQLRAERSGTGSGRVYSIEVTATDSAGNVSVSTVEVKVPRNPSGR